MQVGGINGRLTSSDALGRVNLNLDLAKSQVAFPTFEQIPRQTKCIHLISQVSTFVSGCLMFISCGFAGDQPMGDQRSHLAGLM
jgi:hypothetical protein